MEKITLYTSRYKNKMDFIKNINMETQINPSDIFIFKLKTVFSRCYKLIESLKYIDSIIEINNSNSRSYNITVKQKQIFYNCEVNKLLDYKNGMNHIFDLNFYKYNYFLNEIYEIIKNSDEYIDLPYLTNIDDFGFIKFYKDKNNITIFVNILFDSNRVPIQKFLSSNNILKVKSPVIISENYPYAIELKPIKFNVFIDLPFFINFGLELYDPSDDVFEIPKPTFLNNNTIKLDNNKSNNNETQPKIIYAENDTNFSHHNNSVNLFETIEGQSEDLINNNNNIMFTNRDCSDSYSKIISDLLNTDEIANDEKEHKTISSNKKIIINEVKNSVDNSEKQINLSNYHNSDENKIFPNSIITNREKENHNTPSNLYFTKDENNIKIKKNIISHYMFNQNTGYESDERIINNAAIKDNNKKENSKVYSNSIYDLFNKNINKMFWLKAILICVYILLMFASILICSLFIAIKKTEILHIIPAIIFLFIIGCLFVIEIKNFIIINKFKKIDLKNSGPDSNLVYNNLFIWFKKNIYMSCYAIIFLLGFFIWYQIINFIVNYNKILIIISSVIFSILFFYYIISIVFTKIMTLDLMPEVSTKNYKVFNTKFKKDFFHTNILWCCLAFITWTFFISIIIYFLPKIIKFFKNKKNKNKKTKNDNYIGIKNTIIKRKDRK